MNTDYLQSACREMIRELTKLVDSGVSLDCDRFHDMCWSGHFVACLYSNYGDAIRLEYLNPESEICDPEVLNYFNDGILRYENVIEMEDFGLKKNALLLGINLTFAISEEIKQLTRQRARITRR